MVPKWRFGRGTPPVRWLQQHFCRKTSLTLATATSLVFLTLVHPFCMLSFFVVEKLQPLYIEMAAKRTPQALQQPSKEFPRITLKHPRSPREHPRAPREPPGTPQEHFRAPNDIPRAPRESPRAPKQPPNHQTSCFYVLCVCEKLEIINYKLEIINYKL